MKPYLKFLLCIAAVLSIAAAGNIYYEVLPGLQIKHPITGATTATINGTNGTVTAGFFVGNGSGLTGLPSGGAIVGTLVTNGTSITAGDLLMAGSRLTNVVSAGKPLITNSFGYIHNAGTSLSNTANLLIRQSDGALFQGVDTWSNVDITDANNMYQSFAYTVTTNSPAKQITIGSQITDSTNFTKYATYQMAAACPDGTVNPSAGLSFEAFYGDDTSVNLYADLDVDPFSIQKNFAPVFKVQWDGSVSAVGTVSANAVDAAELYTGSFKIYSGTLTPLDAGTQLDFAQTNRDLSCTLTGNVSYTTANLVAGKCFSVRIIGCSTNSLATYPAGWHWYPVPQTNILANKWHRLTLRSWGTTDANVEAALAQEQ